MVLGQFVEHKDWKIWVEDEWLDRHCPTHKIKAKEIYESGWLMTEERMKELSEDWE